MSNWLNKYKDKEKRREYNKQSCKEYYTKNKDRMKKQTAISNKKSKEIKKARLLSEFGNRCEVCGFNTYPEILQFHHKEEKKEAIAHMLKYRNYDLIIKEAKKCQLLCPNCHMILHYKLFKCKG